jgi:hypothetical protein
MVPSEIDLSIAVEREVHTQATSLAAQWETRLEQARYEARRAERRYKAVDPDNRVVARTLEREWEARLKDLDDVERQYAEVRRQRRVELSAADRDALRAIARDLPAVWRGPTTTPADRKAMLRLVIEAITLKPVDIPKRTTQLRVQWRSGVVDELYVERPGRATATSIIDQVRALIEQGLHDDEIAARFNDDGLLTAKSRPWTGAKITRLRSAHSIAKPPRPRNRALPERHPVTNRFSIPGAAKRFGIPRHTVKNWVRAGLVPAHRERYGRYDAVWLDIDDDLAAKLERLPPQR